MTADDFRRIALELPEASQNAHMGHPDFRVGGKIFATLGYPDEHFAVVLLTPDEQAAFVRAAPRLFTPVKGGWGTTREHTDRASGRGCPNPTQGCQNRVAAAGTKEEFC